MQDLSVNKVGFIASPANDEQAGQKGFMQKIENKKKAVSFSENRVVRAEYRRIETSFMTDLNDMGSSFQNMSARMFGDTIRASGEFASSVERFIVDEQYRKAKINGAKGWIEDSYESTVKYGQETLDDFSKPFEDVWDFGVKKINEISTGAKELKQQYEEAKEEGRGADFIGETLAKSTPTAIAIGASVTPVGKATSFFKGDSVPDFIPEGSEKFNNRKTKIEEGDLFSKGRNAYLVKRLNRLNLYISVMEEVGFVTNKSAKRFIGIATSREELFEKAKSMIGNPSIMIIDPRVDRTGLINYLTRAGASLAHDQEFALVKFQYNDPEYKFSYSPTILVTSAGQTNVEFGELLNMQETLGAKLKLIWHNHPSSSEKFSEGDMVVLSQQEQKSSILSTISHQDGMTGVRTLRKTNYDLDISDSKKNFQPIFDSTDRDRVLEYNERSIGKLIRDYFFGK